MPPRFGASCAIAGKANATPSAKQAPASSFMIISLWRGIHSVADALVLDERRRPRREARRRSISARHALSGAANAKADAYDATKRALSLSMRALSFFDRRNVVGSGVDLNRRSASAVPDAARSCQVWGFEGLT